MSGGSQRTERIAMKRTLKAKKKCAEFLAEMLKVGWTKDELPALEKVFWQFRDPVTGDYRGPRKKRESAIREGK